MGDGKDVACNESSIHGGRDGVCMDTQGAELGMHLAPKLFFTYKTYLSGFNFLIFLLQIHSTKSNKSLIFHVSYSTTQSTSRREISCSVDRKMPKNSPRSRNHSCHYDATATKRKSRACQCTNSTGSSFWIIISSQTPSSRGF